MKTALDPRHTNRQNAVSDLFAWAFHKQRLTNPTAKEVTKHLGLVDKIITECAPEFTLDRINNIDLAILRLAVYELVVLHNQPPKVIIDEAIELAKEFGGESSPTFINGALGKVFSSKTRIMKLIAESFGVDEQNVTPQSSLRSELNASDIEISDLLAKLESEINIIIEKGSDFDTVGDILNYVEDRII
ncbi:hypothetical protein HY310_00125 [Candidatus Microgenomates bacterium]|nr:hypothetical protein [Candidatus Microgenomates bacterium]